MANMFGSHQNIAQNRAHNKNKSFTSALSSQTSSQSRSKSGFRIEGGDYSSETKLHQTPTWAVAGVCAIIIIISIALEKVLHKLGKLGRVAAPGVGSLQRVGGPCTIPPLLGLL
ncbi:hypothetical protein HanRHA438_Chr12g0534501 [Helianthus annuus]|nr:hypothetical protein HanIR_Chr12g0563341 [Helianthus annuus]KAJ0503858.1 hypothetical protein HanHA89_Chr12g0453001 [Helianthus annuus]KAJ0676901.1 hypothetical protein HanOQP8_Chr12g0431101 [Helianthus annuus]KAJ0864869.1 hypothetical protein HanRHA438_Chr12g0534501 [Helianthus annuus]